MGMTSYVFHVKGTGEAHVALTSIPGDAWIHTIVIGIGVNGNSQVVMWNEVGGNQVAQRDVPNVLNANNYTAFWVSWANDVIQFGHGDIVHQSILLKHNRVGFPLPVSSLAFESKNTQIMDWILKPDPVHLTTGRFMPVFWQATSSKIPRVVSIIWCV